MSDAVDALAEESRRVMGEAIANHPSAEIFAGFSQLFERTGYDQPVPGLSLPVVDEWLSAAVHAATGPWTELADRLLAATPELPWIRSYESLESTPELESFRSFYSYQLFAGPYFRGYDPPLLMDELLVGFTLQAPNIVYPAHHHEAPEMYGIISGTLEWQVGDVWATQRPGDVIVHRSHESHAMRTLNEPALTWVLWPRNPSCQVYMPSFDPPERSQPPRVYH